MRWAARLFANLMRWAASLFAAFLIAWAAPAVAAIGPPHVLFTSAGGTGGIGSTACTSCVVTLTNSAAVGETVVVSVKNRAAASVTVSSVADSAGNCTTYSHGTAVTDAGNIAVQQWYCVDIATALTGGSSTITITMSGSLGTYSPVEVDAVSGVTGVDSHTSTGASGTSTAPSLTLASPAGSPEIAFALIEGGTQDIKTESPSFTSLTGVNGGSYYDSAYQTITSGGWGNSSTYTPTMAASTNWATNYLSFTGASAPPALGKANPLFGLSLAQTPFEDLIYRPDLTPSLRVRAGWAWGSAPSGGGFCASDSYSAVDGCASAPCPGDMANNGTMLSGETATPAWWSAGVQYKVGLCAADATTSVLSASFPSACAATLDTTNHLLRIPLSGTGVTCNLTLIDFSPGGGYQIYLEGPSSGGHCGTINITHSNFLVGSNNLIPIEGTTDMCSLVTITDNNLDGGAAAGHTADPLIDLGPTSNSVYATILRNSCTDFVAHCTVDSTPDVIHYNYCANWMYSATAHADCFHENTGSGAQVSESGLTLTYNTCYQPAANGSNLPGQANDCWFVAGADGSGPAVTMSDVTISNNTVRGIGSAGHLCAVSGTNCSAIAYITEMGGASSSTMNNVTMADNYFDTSTVGIQTCNYTGSSGFWTGTLNFSGNIQMNTGTGDATCNTTP